MLARIQRLGGFLSSMVIPNIGAFIAWGLITALFIPDGWLGKTSPDWDWGKITDALVGPMIVYLLPALVAYTGGKLIYGHRGGVLAAIAVFGIIGSQGNSRLPTAPCCSSSRPSSWARCSSARSPVG